MNNYGALGLPLKNIQHLTWRQRIVKKRQGCHTSGSWIFRQLIRATNANGKVTTYQYCDCGSLNSITDPLGNITSFSYDNLGRRTRVTDPGNSGNIYFDFNFDAVGRVTSVTNSVGVCTTNFF